MCPSPIFKFQRHVNRKESNLTNFAWCYTSGRLQGRWVADEEHGSLEWQCGYTAPSVHWQICLWALEGWWVEGDVKQQKESCLSGGSACGGTFNAGFPVLRFIVFTFSFVVWCVDLCFYLLKSHLLFPSTSSSVLSHLCHVILLCYWVSEVQNCQRAYFYQRFPILHSDSGDWASFQLLSLSLLHLLSI